MKVQTLNRYTAIEGLNTIEIGSSKVAKLAGVFQSTVQHKGATVQDAIPNIVGGFDPSTLNRN